MNIGYYLIGAAVVGILTLLYFNGKKHSRPQATRRIQKHINAQIGKHDITGALVLVDSPAHQLHQTFTAGNITEETQPFHVASVGKTLTAALVGTLIDDGALRLEDKVAEYLEAELLQGLFVVDGADYSGEVTVRQLLSHTSGAADYFEDAARGVPPMREQALTDRDKRWTPRELVAFTRTYQSAVARPGERFHYSDTGYILLGLLLEKVSGLPFHRLLHEKIFEPLHMDDSYLLFYSKPKKALRPIADVWLEDENIKDDPSLSLDWAGGGIVSTAHDLAVFIRALHQGKVISAQTLAAFSVFDQTYMRGIHYGCGLMEYRFGEWFFTLKKLPNYVGHMGVLGTQMMYDRQSDSVYIASFGSSAAPAVSVKSMIKVLSILRNIKA